MVENLIVALIVGGSAWYAGARYLPASVRRRFGQKAVAGDCGSGCGSCNNCDTATPAPAIYPAPLSATASSASSATPGKHRVIAIHKVEKAGEL